MEKIYSDGQARAIGVSNYAVRHLEELVGVAEVMPMVNQVELVRAKGIPPHPTTTHRARRLPRCKLQAFRTETARLPAAHEAVAACSA